jgi:predicted Ser/Thr protein kinase
MYEFQEGSYFKDWLKTASKEQKRKSFKNLLKQCYELDRLGITKEEMSRPLKNCIVVKGKPVLIDFERSHKTDKPKNVTQFCQFLMKEYPRKKSVLMSLAKEYKREAILQPLISLLSKN